MSLKSFPFHDSLIDCNFVSWPIKILSVASFLNFHGMWALCDFFMAISLLLKNHPLEIMGHEKYVLFFSGV